MPSCCHEVASNVSRVRCLQKAEDGPYLVKFLLNGSNGTPLRDMLRSISRNLKHPTISAKPSTVRTSNYPFLHSSAVAWVANCVRPQHTEPRSLSRSIVFKGNVGLSRLF